MRNSTCIAAVLLPLTSLTAHAAIQISDASFIYSQDFNSLGSSSGSSATAHSWINDSTLPGWSLFNIQEQAPTTYRAELGNQDVGSFTSYGPGDSSDRALGGIAGFNAYFGYAQIGDNNPAGWIAAAFVNQTGSTLDTVTLSYAGEQWRFASAWLQTLRFSMGIGPSFRNARWVTPTANSYHFVSPLWGGTGLGGVDGNSIGRVSGLGGTQAVDWKNGEMLWLRWSLITYEGEPHHGLAIDDLRLSFTAAAPVPEPRAWALMLGGAVALGAFARRRPTT